MTTPQPVKKPKTGRRSPARSAKILTLGLSTTAMLGMSSGYAFAGLAQNDKSILAPPQTTPVAVPVLTTPSLTPDVLTPVTPSAPTPAEVAPQGSTVIEVPVSGNAAVPGSGSSSWKSQKSSGSN